jgi:threonine aldolase
MIDLRSDGVTRPWAGMRAAMADAEEPDSDKPAGMFW